jgi:hypothetical protein
MFISFSPSLLIINPQVYSPARRCFSWLLEPSGWHLRAHDKVRGIDANSRILSDFLFPECLQQGRSAVGVIQ